jgi:glycine/D-amino acid oxidase-like deaminating enzyme
VDRIEEIAREENIDCEFTRVDGYWFAAKPDHGPTPDAEAAAHAALEQDVERVTVIRRPAGGDGALRFANQGQFHPLKYLSGLARAIVRLGGRIHSRIPCGRVREQAAAAAGDDVGQAHGDRRRRRVRDQLAV